MKPKHKRAEFPSEIDFVTALTVEECLEQLERGPARTLDYRLLVRTDGARFKIEVLGNTGYSPPSMTVLAEMDGYLQAGKTVHLRTKTPATRVVAKTKNIRNPWNPNYAIIPLVFWPIFTIVFMIVQKESSIEFLFKFGCLVGGAFAATLYVYSVYMTEKITRQIPDLHEWLRQQLYEPPALPEG